MRPKMLIGLSVSNCIRDIVKGTVSINQVAYIIGGTNFSLDKPETIEKHYSTTYWKDDPELAHEVLVQLCRERRILQPRQGFGWPLDTSAGHWAAVGSFVQNWEVNK